MTDERLDLAALFDARSAEREERVVRNIMNALATRARPRADVWSAILVVGRPALAAAAALALMAAMAPAPGPTTPHRPPTVGAALGLPLAVERVIHRAEPASAQELLAALQEEP